MRIAISGEGPLVRDVCNALVAHTANHVRRVLPNHKGNWDVKHVFGTKHADPGPRTHGRARFFTPLSTNYPWYWLAADRFAIFDAFIEPCVDGVYYTTQNIMFKRPYAAGVPTGTRKPNWKCFPFIYPTYDDPGPDCALEKRYGRPLAVWPHEPQTFPPTQAILAWPKIVRRYPDATLLILGPTGGINFQQIIDDCGMQERVHLLSPDTRNEVYKMLATTNVVFGFTTKVGPSLASMAALKYGKILLYEGDTGAPQFKHNVNAYHSADDAIVLENDLLYIFDNLPTMYDTIGAGAASQYAHLSETNCAASLVQTYNEVLGLASAGSSKKFHMKKMITKARIMRTS